MKRKILFRADAGAEIGYGHFIRTLALADMLKDDFECVFYTQAPSEYQRKECENVCELVELPADETRFQLFLDKLNGDEIVVLDNYFYTTNYQKAVKEKGCKLVCIDDMHDKHYVADVVVNHGPVTADEFDCEPYTKLYLGDDYKLLRRPFLAPLNNRKRSHSAVINLGGSDPFKLTDKVVSLLIQVNTDYHIVVILGDSVFLSDDNRERVEVRKRLSAEQMADLFETSAFGILPGSTVSVEAMSRALPILMGYQVDNQEEGYKKLSTCGHFIPLGNLHDLNLETLKAAIAKLKDFKPYQLDTSQISNNFIKMFGVL
ncbi:MAG: UDP-2,4-diacetamido-2,4,6-trideoxy-beta-L-altropyranose hydrolase [Bacteroidaceae bacterium]|nr:UDP-2,4-diacetamido-2,4,6-trideoxy-beta-L-altropyranose hydrolase [Bacteroidaceae bacterium]